MKYNISTQILIEKCPQCEGKHTYPLTIIIDRATVMGLSGDKKKQKTITCVFICPNTGEQFESGVPMERAAHEEFLSVQAESASL